MTRLEEDLKGCCNLLDSNKITERKKSVNNLKDLLQRRDVIQLLNSNSENSSGDVSWETLFSASHRGLMKDADKIKEDSRRTGRQQSQATNADIAKPSCALVTLITSKANAGGVFRLPCKLLLRSVLNILEDEFNRKYFGATYIQILQHRILNSSKYCTEILPELWKDLLKEGIALYKNLPPAVDKATAAALLELIIQKGCEQSFLARHVKKRFPFFVDAVKNDSNISLAVEKNLLQLAVTVCQQLGKESRMAICKFGEQISSDIIDRYEYRAEEFSRKKAVVLDFLVLQVKAHHPGGAKQGSMAAYAHQWDIWKNQLKQMYRLVYGEIVFILKQDSNKVYHLKENFLTLAVNVCKQVFEGDSDSSPALDMSSLSVFNDTNAGPASKRIRLETGIPALLSQLKSVKKPIDMWPWLAVLTSLISTYPELVSEAALESLLQFVSDQQQACKNTVIMEYLCRCCVALLKVEDQINTKSSVTLKLSSIWEAIYNTTLRAIGLNLSEEHTHYLIQTLISRNKKFPVKPLINVFMTASIHLSEFSLTTLNILSQKCALFDEVEIKGCKALQDWILPTKEDLIVEQWGQLPSCYNVMARVLLALTFKSAVPSIKTCPELCTSGIEISVEQSYVLTVFESGLLVGNNEESPTVNEQNSTEIVHVDETLFIYLVRLLERETHIILDKTGQDNKAAFSYLTPYCHLLVEIIQYMQKWDLPNRDRLTEYLKRCANKLSQVLKDILGRERDCSFLSDVLEKIGNLFEHAGINDHNSDLCVLSNFYDEHILPECLRLALGKFSGIRSQQEDAFNFGDEEEQNTVTQFAGSLSPLSEEFITGWSVVRMAALKALVKYSCAPAHYGSSYNVHIELISQLFRSLPMESSQILRPVNLQMSLYLVRSVMKAESLHNNILEKILVFVQGLCQKWHPYSEVVLELLGILEELVEIVHKFTNGVNSMANDENLVVLIRGFTKFVKEGKYGARVCEHFVKCIGRCAVVDPMVKWSKWTTGTLHKDEINVSEYLPVAHEILVYISSPFHQVRMTAASFISNVFKLDPVGQQIYETYLQKRAFIAMMFYINDAFVVEGDVMSDEQQDEGVLRTASCLHCMAAVIATSCKWRSKGLLELFDLSFKKKLNPDLVKKVLNLIGYHLKIPDVSTLLEENLRYLVWEWLDRYKTLNDFPWKLFGSVSESDFFSQYAPKVVPILIHIKSINCLKLLSIIVNLPLPALIKTCYPQIVAPILAGFGSPSSMQNKVKEIYDIVKNIIGEESMKELLSVKLADVLLAIMELLYDPELMGTICKSSAELSFPEPEQLSFKTDAVTGAMEYLQQTSPDPNIRLLAFLSKEMPSYVEKIFLQLCSNIHEAVTPEYRLLCLQRYIIFCEILIPSIDSQRHKMARYVINFVIHSLLRLLNGDLKLPVLCYLKQLVVVHLLPGFSEIVNTVLHILVPALVAEAKADLETDNTALCILHELVIKHHKVLPAIAYLDPLPSELDHLSAKYNEIRYSASSNSLESEIKHFLDAGKEVFNPSNRVFGLKHLRKQLSEKKSELASLYKSLEIRNSSTDSSSILHQLICMLIELASSEDSDVKVLSACCLGELGVGNLTTLLLKTEQHVQDLPVLLGLLSQVIVLLSRFLTDTDISVVKAASAALYAVFTENPKHAVIDAMCDTDREVLYPFLYPVKKSKKTLKITLNKELLKTVVEYFCPLGAVSHAQWITRLVCGLLECSSLAYLQPVCISKVLFSEEILPYLVDLILYYGSDECISFVIEKINEFFLKHTNMIENSSTFQIKLDNTKEVYGNRASVQCMLNTVNMIRLKQQHYKSSLDLNYLHIAKAAQFCMAFFTSIFYAELWCNDRTSEANKQPGTSQLEYFCQQDAENGSVLQSILFEAYTKIGEPDAVYGCGNSNYLDYNNRIKHYQYEGKWDRVIEALDVQLSSNLILDKETSHFSVEKSLMNALHRYGLHYLAGHCKSTEKIEEAEYEYGWRLGQWNLPDPVAENLDTNCHQSLVYAALRALHHKDKERALKIIDTARHQILQSLAYSSLEASNSVYSVISKLQSLQDIEDFAENNLDRVVDKWKEQDKVGWNNFKYVEPVVAQRLTMLKSIASMRQDLRDMSIKLFLSASETARQEGFYTEAARWLICLNTVPELEPFSLFTKQLQEAQLFWDRGESRNARYLLLLLIKELEDRQLPALYSSALRIYGSWMADSKLESAQQIVDEYLMPALEAANSVGEECVLQAASSLAYYADFEYENLLKYMQSPIYTSKVEAIEDSITSSLMLQEQFKTSQSNELKRSISVQNKLHIINRNEVENTARELEKYLLLAVRYYIESLVLGDCNNLRIFRVASLWLNNCSDAELQTELETSLNRIPSHKFLPVLPQLIVRINDSVDELFTKILHNLIEKCAVDHPHHTLPLLLALFNSNKDSTVPVEKCEPRVLGAQLLVKNLLKTAKLGSLLNDMQKVAEAYISLASCPRPDNNKKGTVYKIPETEPITKLKDCTDVLCPTVTLPVNKCGRYDNIIGIHKFEDTMYYVGGINLPKKIVCICTDGVKRTQLVKGNDDLRQDAVMQQVFTIMNILLQENKETRNAKLHVKTYKVVPLSQRSGVLEWCTNTIPLSTYLLGGHGVTGAHEKYRPNDYPPSVCRAKLDVSKQDDAIKRKATSAEKLRIFKEICANFKPVFHHFFLEKFRTPGLWFERRLAYTHSVATSSMIGYILGLGDRHVLNILIDQSTAEVIHIDLGIAFEQGLLLPTPETVPFRLTRDIEDGMGICGTEGVFRRTCEKTMQVLRDCQDTIITILEVLLYDPLYSWTLTPAVAQSKQPGMRPVRSTSTDSPPIEKNKLAERTLLRLRQKLQGIEEGVASSVEGQVSRLIQEATNPNNLCCLFHGWQAFV